MDDEFVNNSMSYAKDLREVMFVFYSLSDYDRVYIMSQISQLLICHSRLENVFY